MHVSYVFFVVVNTPGMEFVCFVYSKKKCNKVSVHFCFEVYLVWNYGNETKKTLFMRDLKKTILYKPL